MRLLELILLVTNVSTVLGAPYLHGSYERLNSRRSLRHPWYRNPDEDLTRYCNAWKSRIEGSGQYGSYWEGLTDLNNFLCMKIHGNIKIMSHCDWNAGAGDHDVPLYVNPTVVEIRESNIYPCYEYDVTMKAVYGKYPDFQSCKVILIDGVLWCIEEQDMVSGEEIMYFFPRRNQNGRVDYKICGTRMETYCNMPARLASFAVSNETFRIEPTYGSGGPAVVLPPSD